MILFLKLLLKSLWPEWYEYRINQGKSSKWSVKRDLYDWWKGKIIENATYGHRYFCLMCLAIFAIKCDVPEEELKRDALALVPILDKLSDDADPNLDLRKKMPYVRCMAIEITLKLGAEINWR